MLELKHRSWPCFPALHVVSSVVALAGKLPRRLQHWLVHSATEGDEAILEAVLAGMMRYACLSTITLVVPAHVTCLVSFPVQV